ncbi:hypothetical protein ACFOZ0_06315 [Streptomyces yaanensis]|uniref:Uncharacterized protein n=1 Tax=Streptomyces yaanensis TaxID=1142239 RepID=A0ABV7S8T4_9ACTN|nr:hypothetical protein [Streptomyces sp. CGMCC 4.7035]WNC02418.1 hypothetical protein Q2K21_32575 [Streptomyces sp. CGMCC 4.7035]
MPAHVSIFQLLGVPVLALMTAVWIVYVGRVVRRRRFEDAARRRGTMLRTLPRQPQAGPELESVELTPSERDAFARLMRQFRDGRF